MAVITRSRFPKELNEYTATIYPDVTNSFSVHVFPEGFKDGESFENALINLYDQLKSIAPFDLIDNHDVLTFVAYDHWILSPPNTQNLGPVDTATLGGDLPEGRTNFDSYYQYQGGQWFYDWDRVKFRQTIESVFINIPYSNVQARLADFIGSSLEVPYAFTRNNVVLILTPDIFPVGPIFDGAQATDNLDNGLAFRYHVINASPTGGKFLARIIAEAMGLRAETIEPSVPYFAPTSDEDKFKIYQSPNLIYLPTIAGTTYIPTDDFKWNKFLTSSQISNGIGVHNTPSALSNIFYMNSAIELWQGGGDFQTSVYRSAENCLMKSKIGFLQARVKTAIDDFCPVCRSFIQDQLYRLPGEVFKANAITLQNQLLKYDQVSWGTLVEQTENNAISSGIVSMTTQPLGVSDEYWSFNVQSLSTNPLRISDIKVKNQQRSSNRIVEEVMNSIEFGDLGVWFEGDSDYTPFPISTVFGGNKASRYIVENGESLEFGNLFQKGVKLVMEHDFGGSCNVTIILSGVFRGKVKDFDPGGAAHALKFYPQISYRWTPGTINPKAVKNFKGRVIINGNTHHSTTNPTCAHTTKNFIELFTDSNTGATSLDQYKRKHKYEMLAELELNDIDVTIKTTVGPIIPISQWSFMFDYYKVFLDNYDADSYFDHIFTAVHGPNSNKFDVIRDGTLTFNPPPFIQNDNFKVRKVQRQGAYDNIHITGDMGRYNPVLVENGESLKIIAAPFCAEDCIHLHFRWGDLGPLLATITFSNPNYYRGWAPNSRYSLPFSINLQPLVPPNQEIKMRAIDPPDGFHRIKIWEYQAEVFRPAPGSTNVIMEQGAAYAVEAANSIMSLLKAFFDFAPDTIVPDGFDWISDNYEFLKKVYGRIRFTTPIDDNSSGQNVQTGIPTGNVVTNTNISLEQL